ncbi:hypothetical protein CSKR_108603 [Clonorchis sinensis]|uniref:Uncharacterized protein n=1 Tax=Clonorchis sinensis TaxID=79923 RepID=A0A8T1M0X9_CLOSI|nr:hypothetical protein CSKR_108603 [Clonorchis sinensis]
MAIYFICIAAGLLQSVVAWSIPQFDLCIEACGEDPQEDDYIAFEKMELCRDVCNYEERNRCLERQKKNKAGLRKCWRDALNRCIVRCGDNERCLQTCHALYTRPATSVQVKHLNKSRLPNGIVRSILVLYPDTR